MCDWGSFHPNDCTTTHCCSVVVFMEENGSALWNAVILAVWSASVKITLVFHEVGSLPAWLTFSSTNGPSTGYSSGAAVESQKCACHMVLQWEIAFLPFNVGPAASNVDISPAFERTGHVLIKDLIVQLVAKAKDVQWMAKLLLRRTSHMIFIWYLHWPHVFNLCLNSVL